MSPLLKVENLTIRPRDRRLSPRYTRSRRELIDDVSFEVAKGRITGLVGDTGSGKLALALAILGIQKASAGAIHFDGGKDNLLQLSQRRLRGIRRKIQLLLPDENRPLNPRQTIGSQIRQLLRLHMPELKSSQRDARIENVLAAVDLPSAVLSRRPDQIIAALRQRAAIARALVVAPKMLICHDITSGIDVTVQAEILNLLKDLATEFDLTLLFITHDLAVADHMSDHILILNRGRIVESGTPEAIVGHPEHDFTRRLVASTTTLR